MRFLVPLCDKKAAPSKLGLIAKIKKKLDLFKADFGLSWNELVEIQLKQVQSKPSLMPNGESAKASF